MNKQKRKEKNKMMNNENGRSMVEMLGVLAIIGVLSVAGIAGYTMAMKRYKANEIVNLASTLYTLAEANYLIAGEGNEYDAEDNAGLTLPSGVTMVYQRAEGATKGTVTVGGVVDICPTIQAIIGTSAEYTISCS